MKPWGVTKTGTEFACTKSKQNIPLPDPVWFPTKKKCQVYNAAFIYDLPAFIDVFLNSPKKAQRLYYFTTLVESKKNQIRTWLLVDPALTPRIRAIARTTQVLQVLPLNLQVTTKKSSFSSKWEMQAQVQALSTFSKFIARSPQFKRYFITVFDIVVGNKTISQIMETMEGDGTQFVSAYQNDPLYFQYVEQIVKQLATGLLALRAADIYLQDVKPQNFVYSFTSTGDIIAKWIDLDCVTRESNMVIQCTTEDYHDVFTSNEDSLPTDLANLGLVIYYLYEKKELADKVDLHGPKARQHVLRALNQFRQNKTVPKKIKVFVQGTMGPLKKRLSISQLRELASTM